MAVPNNIRQVLMVTNDDRTVQPLVIVFPQWSKESLDKMPLGRQNKLYDDFATLVGEAWAKLISEE